MIKFEDYLEAVREAVELSEAKARKGQVGDISKSDIKEVNGVLTYKGKVLKTLSGQTVSAGSKHATKLMNLLSQGLWKDMYKNVLKNNQGPMFKYSEDEDFEDDDFDELYEAKGDVTSFKAELKSKGIDLNFLKKDISVSTIRDSGQPYVKIKGHATEYTNIDKFVKDIASKGYMNYSDAVSAVKSKGYRLPTTDEIKNMTAVKGGIGVGNGGVFWAQGGKAWNTLGNYPSGYEEVEANKKNILKVLYVDKSGKLGFYSDLKKSRSQMFT